MPAPIYGPLDEADLPGFCTILNRCFGRSGALEETENWVARFPLADLRTMARGGEPFASLVLVPMGQYFGGKGVRTAGVAGVGVDPAHRGRGHAREMMIAFLSEMRERGFPLSTLYASTFTLYRSVGYERAGCAWRAHIEPTQLVLSPRRADSASPGDGLRPLRAGDEDAVRACRAAWCSMHDGQLERGPYIWNRTVTPQGKPTEALVVEGEGGVVEGYLRWMQVESKDGAFDLIVTDVAAITPRAVCAVLAFFGSQRALVGHIRWPSSPSDPILQLLPERQFELKLGDQWLIRVLDVKAALEARGWPRGLETVLDLEVEDELFPDNAGRYRARISGGRASVEAGGTGSIRTDARGLAPLYSGHLSPAQLVNLGWLEGAPDELERAAAAFAGPAPWCSDMF